MKSEFYIPESPMVVYKPRQTVWAEVVFGMPAKDCLYHGICRIEPADHNSIIGTFKARSYTKAEVSATSTGQLIFRFHKDSIGKGKANRHFGSGYFIVLESVSIPLWLNEALDIMTFNINSGIYKVKESEGWYEVVFT